MIFKPLVSIIIPVYNGSNYLREAIDSALEQTYKNIEVIVINDGSIDDTERIAKSYGDKIRYFKKENGGVSSALNLGLQKMKGEYFSWLSHDDAYYPEKLEKQIEFLSNFKSKNVILYSDYEFIDDNSFATGRMILDHEMLEKKSEYALLRSAVNGNTLLVPKKAFDEYGFFDEYLKCTQDYEMWNRMMKTYKFVHIPGVLVKYRIHDFQDTNKNPKFISEGENLWIKMIEELPIYKKKELEGSELNFYRKMCGFLEQTPYKKTLELCLNKIKEEIANKKTHGALVVSFISHSSQMGGAERAMLDIISTIYEDKNIFIHVVLPNDGPLKKALENMSICVDLVEMPWWANIGSDRVAKEVDNRILESSAELVWRLKNIDSDIVFTNTSVISEGAIAAKILGLPHAWHITEFGKKEHGIEYMLSKTERENFINEYSDKVFFVSNALMEYYQNIDKIKSIVFPNIVKILSNDNKRYFKKSDAFKIAIVGNIAQGKGQKDAILAIKELKKGEIDVELNIAGYCGNDDYYRELQNLVDELNLSKHVNFLGYLANTTSLISQSDLMLICSICEGFGRITVESMFHKKPVIGANSGATKELLENNRGLLYEPGDYLDLADKILYLIQHRDEMEKIGKNGFEFVVENFDAVKNSKKIVAEFLKLNKKNERDMVAEMFANFVYYKSINEKKKQKELIDKQIISLKNELNFITSSKFWKMRNLYLKFKFAISSPNKFVKKYAKKLLKRQVKK